MGEPEVDSGPSSALVQENVASSAPERENLKKKWVQVQAGNV
jgi:hypothetical protein